MVILTYSLNVVSSSHPISPSRAGHHLPNITQPSLLPLSTGEPLGHSPYQSLESSCKTKTFITSHHRHRWSRSIVSILQHLVTLNCDWWLYQYRISLLLHAPTVCWFYRVAKSCDNALSNSYILSTSGQYPVFLDPARVGLPSPSVLHVESKGGGHISYMDQWMGRKLAIQVTCVHKKIKDLELQSISMHSFIWQLALESEIQFGSRVRMLLIPKKNRVVEKFR
jgi:hypothetical protein